MGGGLGGLKTQASSASYSEVQKKASAGTGFKKQQFKKKPWDIVICDEAHKLKNHNSKRSVLVGKIKSRQKVLLTGTPIQNRLRELYTLMVHATKGQVFPMRNSQQFYERFQKPIEAGSYQDSSAR